MNSKMTVCTWKQGVGVKTGYGRENQYMYVKMCANGREKTMNVRVKKRENRENGVYGRPSRFSGTFLSDAHAHLEKSMIFSFSTTSLSKLFTFAILAPDECLVLSV